MSVSTSRADRAPSAQQITEWNAILGALGFAATIFDRNMVFLAQNDLHAKMTACPPEDLIGRYVFDVFPAEPGQDEADAEGAVKMSVERVLATGKPDALPVQAHALEDDKGQWHQHSWKLSHAPIMDKGEIVAILQSIQDVTDQVLAQTLAEAQQLAAQEATSAHYFSYEFDTHIFARAVSVDTLFGFSDAEAGPRLQPFFERIDIEDIDTVVSKLKHAESAAVGTSIGFDCRILPRGGTNVHFLRARGVVVINPADRLRKLVGAFIDMTDLEETRLKLQQAVALKENLLLEVNHRVKNSLQLASSILRMESRRASNDEVRESLASANGRIAAIAEVHGGIYLGGDVTQVQTRSVVENITEALSRSVGAGETSADIRCSFADFALPTDHAIAFGLLVNELLTNAIKYGGHPSARAIEVETRLNGKTAQLKISNDLAGHHDVTAGTGVGMKLVKGFLRQLKADLSQSQTNGRFCIQVSFDT